MCPVNVLRRRPLPRLIGALALVCLVAGTGIDVACGQDSTTVEAAPSWVDRPTLTLPGLEVIPSEPVRATAD
jgi:hypothetical protein